MYRALKEEESTMIVCYIDEVVLRDYIHTRIDT